MKTIVTHIGPDLDAITAIWLIKKFMPAFLEADIAFVPAGKTYKDLQPDTNLDIIHVDTGMGKFDHHQGNEDTCSARLVYEEIKKTKESDQALARLVAVVNDIDHFREVDFPNPNADFYDFGLPAIIDGWRVLYSDNPILIATLTMDCLDAVYKMFQNKVWAEKDIQEKAVLFETRFGKGFAIETMNDEVVHYGQKMGYVIAIRRDPRKGYLRVKAVPKNGMDLTGLYEKFKSEDSAATWYLHPSRCMILNGSSKNPDMRPTTLPLPNIIEIVKSVLS